MLAFVYVNSFVQAQHNIAPTDPLTPEEQRVNFHLPPGFEIQLVAAEPEIGQPMNLNFDSRGRLWVSHSVEYPYPSAGPHVQERDARFGPVSQHAPKDRVSIISGIDAKTGRPTQIEDFQTGLNIPIGLVPVHRGALIYSIPNIQLIPLKDQLNATVTRNLYGPFGNVDTHGMTNSFTRWIDGWVYACHGFRNETTIRGTDGTPLEMQSGNIYRFREDGTHAESFTRGQVNPFGLTFDEWGNLYSADCHSKPLTLLLRGSHYSSFGKPHDGLGFGPDMIDHSHGSTGICGPVYYEADQFPDAYRHSMFLCNPVTGRVHRDKLINHGSTRIVDTQPDFITCDDPWFRPVDLTLGPDGALYLADFYNAIIGHYEVPLEHEKRDRIHGRIWRIVYSPEDHQQTPRLTDLHEQSLSDVANQLNSPNLTVRMLATNEIVDRFPGEAVREIRARINGESSFFRAHAVYVLHRLDGLSVDSMQQFAGDADPRVRTHLGKVLAEVVDWKPIHTKIATNLLFDDIAFVRRAAAEAMGLHPHLEHLEPLLKLFRSIDESDTHLKHSARIAIRAQIRSKGVLAASAENFTPEMLNELVPIFLSIQTPRSAELVSEWLETHLQTLNVSDVRNGSVDPEIRHVSRYGSVSVNARLAATLRGLYSQDSQISNRILSIVSKEYQQRQMMPSDDIKKWAITFIEKELKPVQSSWGWTETESDDSAFKTWQLTDRNRVTDGPPLWSSFPNGEQRTGVLRSEVFPLPGELSFSIAGHCGFPDKPSHGRNRVVLRDAKTRAVIKTAIAPRNDTAQRIHWGFENPNGRTVFLELIDGDSGRAYAWLSVGLFSIEELNPTDDVNRTTIIPGLVRQLDLHELSDTFSACSNDKSLPFTQRLIAAECSLALSKNAPNTSALKLARMPSLSMPQRESLLTHIANLDSEELNKAVDDSIRSLSLREVLPVIRSMSSIANESDHILKLVKSGAVAAQVLKDPDIQRNLETRGDAVKHAVEELTAALPKESDQLANRIQKNLTAYPVDGAQIDIGKAMFKQHCAACHKIGNEGSIIGPQLDGIGNRGVERLLEDVLDPNRNIDAAFRTETIVTTEGKILSGLFRREEGTQRIYADSKGKEFSVQSDEIEARKVSPLSLMPVNVTKQMSPRELHSLMQYLLTLSTPRKSAP